MYFKHTDNLATIKLQTECVGNVIKKAPLLFIELLWRSLNCHLQDLVIKSNYRKTKTLICSSKYWNGSTISY